MEPPIGENPRNRPPSLHPVKALIVEDEVSVCQFLERALVEAGFPSASPPEGIGYEFHMEATPTGFGLSARPTSYSPGARSFYLDETGNLLGGDNGGQWGDARQ